MFYSSHENRKENKYTYSYKYQSTIFIIENYSSPLFHLTYATTEERKPEATVLCTLPFPLPIPPQHPTRCISKSRSDYTSRHRYRRTIETSELSRPVDSLSLHTPPHLLASSQKRARGEGGEGNLASASSGSERNCLNERVDAWRERRSAEMMKTTVAAAADRGGNN